jgi:hypothetical protein
MASRFFLNSTPLNSRTRYAFNGTSTYFDMSGADVAAGGVATSNVRAGVTYAGLTGTLAVPPAASVSLGVPVDNTTGTAVLTGSDMASAVWGAATRTLTAGGSISASDVWDYATRTLTSASGPTAVEIRQEMDSNSTKLANLDATVSSRLAPSGTLAVVTTLTNAPAVPSAAAIATQVRTELGAELGRLDANISSRLAPSGTLATVTTLTNAPTVPTAAAIASQVRTELATELARVDVATSTRLAGSAYSAPANSDITAIKAKTDNLPASPAATGDIPSANITAIKAKTDLLNTDRLAQVSTVSTTGAQLAAALS